MSYKIEGEWQFYCIPCTTDPGSHWVENILSEKGVAILKPNQYRGSHKLRLHAGKYLALGQKKDVTVYRDNNRDDKYDLDESKTDTGLFGINIHRATGKKGGKSTRVDKWSAGCQVIADNDDWHTFLDICQTAREIHGKPNSGCIGMLACEYCGLLVSDSICLCIGIFNCPKCNKQNGHQIR